MKTSPIIKIFKTKYVQIVTLIILYSLCQNHLNLTHKSILYSLSVCIKQLLVLAMPITVASYMAHTIKHFGRNALTFLIFLICFEFISNYVSIWFTYGASHIVIDKLCTIPAITQISDLPILFEMPISKPWWYTADKGVLVGILIGFFLKKSQFIESYKSLSDLIISKFFVRLIPFFVLGMYVNMDHKKIIHGLARDCGLLVVMYVVILITYNSLIYFIANNFSIKKTLISLKNMLPAWFVGFTSGCSISTMPLTIQCTEKNLTNKSLAGGLIPATTNIQQIADCIMMSFVGCFLYSYYFGHLPGTYEWFKFSIIFTLARFTVTAVIGGAIFILLPIFEKFLGFSSEMVMIFITINMVLDPIVTAFNILANGGMAIIFEKVFTKFSSRKSKSVLKI